MTTPSLVSPLLLHQPSQTYPINPPPPVLAQIEQKLHHSLHKDCNIDQLEADWSTTIPATSLGIIAPVPNTSTSQPLNKTCNPTHCIDTDAINPFDHLVQKIQSCIDKIQLLLDPSETKACNPFLDNTDHPSPTD